jgi:hypothetical protein
MKISGFCIILLILVLVSFAIVPIASGEEQNNSVQATINPCGIASAPAHCIPPEYFKDAKLPTPLSESEMITIIISGQTFERFAGEKQPGILAVPIPYLDYSVNFTNSTSSPTWHYEKNLAPDEPVAMIRMSGKMYDRMLSMSDGKNLELPVSVYVRQYSNLTDLHAQIEPDGMYLKDTANGSDDTGTKPSPTVPQIIVTTPRFIENPRTQPTPLSAILVIHAIGCITIFAAIRKQRRE